MSQTPRLPTHHIPTASLVATALFTLFAGCGNRPAGTGGGGGGGGGGGVATVVPRDWGPLPTSYRGPGPQASFAYRPNVTIDNRGPARNATILASIPFVWGQVQDLSNWSAEGLETSWRVLQRWPDQSVRVAQAQWTMDLPAGSRVTQSIVDGSGSSVGGTFVPNPAFATALPWIGVQVEDPFGIVHESAFYGSTETLHETAMVRTRRQRTYPFSPFSAAPGGLGRNYLTATFYVT